MNINYCKYFLFSIIAAVCLINCKNKRLSPEFSQFYFNDSFLKYRILYPENFDKAKKYPLTLFLHGISERGDDNELQLKYVDQVFLNPENYNMYPSIVIFPQAPLSDNWSSRVLTDNEMRYFFPENENPTNSLQLVIELMDSLLNENYVDKKRVYLTGLSNGAMGSLELLKNRPNMFASAVLICGGGNPSWVKQFSKTTPVWIAHGLKDRVVHPELSLKIAEAIIREGGDPKITFYEDVFHDSWLNVFSDPNYLEWLFSHAKN